MKHPVIFVDMHHQQLYESLQRLVEGRLGGTLLRPIGVEWFERNLWMNAKIYGNHPDTIKQYLEIRNSIPTKMGPRNNVIGEEEDYYLVENPYKTEKAITYEQFMKAKDEIDIIMASYYDNIEPYSRLAKEIGKPTIMQMGNAWDVPWHLVNNVLASTGKFPVPPGKNVVFYHQEFDIDNFFYKGEPNFESKKMYSFVHCLFEHDIFKQDLANFLELEKLMPEYEFKSYGISNRDEVVTQQKDLADKMRECKFGIHFKNGGDGYGYTVHNWFSVGRPVIFKSSQYRGKLAENLLKHLVTGLDLDHMSLVDISSFIRNQTKEDYEKMSENAYKAFKENVDFDKEEKEIRSFLSRLI